jgi:oligopeptide transport system permease protein
VHRVLPVVALGLFFAARIARLVREGVIQTLPTEMVTAARARGLSEARILWRHVLRLAVLPVVAYAGPLLADLLTGSFVVENVFQIPGIGAFLVNSTLSRDYSMVVGLVVIYAALLLVLNVAADWVLGWLDPRVRHEG